MGGISTTEGGFTWADSTVFGVMLGLTVCIGLFSGFRGGGSSTKQFMIGGNNMHPVPVALSLLGGVFSAISILGNASEVYYYGTQVTINLLGMIPGTVLVCKCTIPLFYKLNITSLLEYLELRYRSRPLRQLITVALLINTAVYMSMCLYAPSLALSTVSTLTSTSSILIMGVICSFYITIGGVKAVVYNDVPQTFLMFLGILLVIIQVCKDSMPMTKVWEIAREGGRLEFFNMDPSPYIRHTFCSTFLSGAFIMVYWVGLSQSPHQRFISVNTLKKAKGLCVFFCVGTWVLWSVFFFSGLVAYALYQHCDPLKAGWIKKADQIIPYLVRERLGHLPGMAGLFVATVYGGVLSSISSQANSAACLIWEDFLKNLPVFSRLTDLSATRVMKVLSALVGLIGMSLGLLVGRLGNVFSVMQMLVNTIAGPYSGVFFAGIFFPWVSAKGAVSGFLVSVTFSVWIVVGKLMKGGGAPPLLPLAVYGCTNITTNITNILISNILTPTNITPTNITNITNILTPTNITPTNITNITNILTPTNITNITNIATNITPTIFNITNIATNITNIITPTSIIPNIITNITTNIPPITNIPTNIPPTNIIPNIITTITTNTPTNIPPLTNTPTNIPPITPTPTNITSNINKEEASIYDLSYCLSGPVGMVITMMVAGVVSLITGPVPPKEVCGRGLINPTCEKAYQWAWKRFRQEEEEEEEEEEEGGEDTEGVGMIQRRNPTLNSPYIIIKDSHEDVQIG